MATYRCHVFVLGKMMDIIKLPIITLLVLQLLLVCYSDICNRIISNKFIISIIFCILPFFNFEIAEIIGLFVFQNLMST